MSEQANYAFIRGNVVPIEEANINIRNNAFMYGMAVFEGIRGYWNDKQQEVYLFRLREHYERMLDSLRIMRMELKYSLDELCALTVELVKRNKPTSDSYIRPCAYSEGQKIGPNLAGTATDLCIFTAPFGDYFHGAAGLKVCISSWRRVEDNAIPARGKIIGAYANTALAKTDALAAGFDECIMLSENGHVSEGSAMNLFMVKRGQLITTPTTENILEGITRNTIIEFVEAEFGLKTVSRTIDRSELYTADELFFCGTGAQIAPISSVDHRELSGGKAGPLTLKIKEKYVAICRGDVPKYERWLTPVYNHKKSAMAPSKPAAAGKS